MVESFLEAMDKATISGTGIGMPLGIANDPRVTNVVEMTAADIINWTAWRTKLFSKIPIKKRGSGEFLFSASTVETCLLTMHDDNNRPLFKEATDGVIGNEAGKFFGRETTLVEPDVIADFDTASAGDIIGVYWIPNDYGSYVNSTCDSQGNSVQEAMTINDIAIVKLQENVPESVAKPIPILPPWLGKSDELYPGNISTPDRIQALSIPAY